MSDLDYRGLYVTGFIDYQQMRELVHDCPPYAINAKVGSPYVAIRDRFVVFEDCQIDDTTLIEVEHYDFKSRESTMTNMKVLDILKEEPRSKESF